MKYLILIILSWTFFSWGQNNPLLSMTREPSAEQLQKWIDEGHNVNARNSDGTTALIISAKNKWHQTAKTLLDNKAHVNTADKDGNTALHHTAYNNDLKIAQTILEHQELAHQGEHSLTERVIESITRRFESDYVKIDAYNKEHKTAFMVAIQKRFLEYAEMLRSRGANIDAQDEHKQTSLFYAVQNKSLSAVRYLNSHGANTKIQDTNKNMSIHIAIHLKLYDIVEVLAMDGNSPLNESSLKHLPPLHTAVIDLDVRMIQILIRAGANVNNIHTEENFRIPPLALLFNIPNVSEDKMVEITQLFVNKKVNVNTTAHSPVEKNTFLHTAVDKGYETLVDVLLSGGARLDVFNERGLSPVTLAIAQNKPNMVRKFIKAGANPNQKPSDHFNFYHLSLAAHYGLVEIVDILLRADASVRVKDANGDTALNKLFETPLNGHARKTDEDVAQIADQLLNAKADPNTQDNDKLTPAMKAVRRNNAQALDILIKHGADLTLTDHLDRTVYDHLEDMKQMQSKQDTSEIEKILSDSKLLSDPSNCEKELTGPA